MAAPPPPQPVAPSPSALDALLHQLFGGQAPSPASAAQTVAPQLQRPVIGQGPAPAVQPGGQGAPAVQPHAAYVAAPAAPAAAAAPTSPVIPSLRPGSDPPATTAANTNTAPAFSPDMSALLQSLPPDMRAAMISKIANDQRLEQSLTDKQNRESAIVANMLKEVPPSYAGTDIALKAPPPTPDIQPIRAFQNWGVALAMLGSLATRRPLTAALKTGAAAMKAYNEGRWQDYAAARQNWKDNVDLAMKQNELEYRRYESARERYHDDLDKQTLAYQQIATEFNDKVALHDIQNGEMDSFLQMRKTLLDEQYKYAALNARYRYGQGGMTNAQRLHDRRIEEARNELKALGIDFNDLKWPQTISNNTGWLSPEDRRKLSLYNIARQPLYADLYGLPGVTGSAGDTPDPGEPPVDGAIPVPPEGQNAPDGPATGPDGSHWVKQGPWLLPADADGNILADTGVAETGIPTLEGDTETQAPPAVPTGRGFSTGGRFGGGFLSGQ